LPDWNNQAREKICLTTTACPLAALTTNGTITPPLEFWTELSAEPILNPQPQKEYTETLFLRWDRRFATNSEKDRANGVYNVHRHRPELELMPYGDALDRSFWEIEYDGNEISLTLLNADSVVTRTFVRIHEFSL